MARAHSGRPIADRIKSKIHQLNGCWEWQGHIATNGYGQICVGSRTDNTRRTRSAHTASYEALFGEIPEGLVLDHLCRNRKCVNPEHLEPVTTQENIRRGELGKLELSKTHCPHGHPYVGDNLVTRTYPGRTKMITDRQCRTCIRERNYRAFLRRQEGRIAS